MHISRAGDQSYVTQPFSSPLTRQDLSLLFISPVPPSPPRASLMSVCKTKAWIINIHILCAWVCTGVPRWKKRKKSQVSSYLAGLLVCVCVCLYVSSHVCVSVCVCPGCDTRSSKKPQRCIRGVLPCCCHWGLSAAGDTERFPSRGYSVKASSLPFPSLHLSVSLPFALFLSR